MGRDGSRTDFDGFTGMFIRHVDPAGNKIEVLGFAPNGMNPKEVQRTYTSGGSTTIDSFLYTFGGEKSQYLQTVLLRRKVDAGNWENISRANYAYYKGSEAGGASGDLKTAVTQTWNGAEWQNTGTSYYRYWLQLTSSSSSSSGVVENGVHLLKYALKPAAFVRMEQDSHDPLTASDAVLALYADYYYEYDASRRVTKEMVEGASQTFLFSYSESENADGYNSWKTRTVETRPDGTQNIVYANYAGQAMLTVLKDGSDEWLRFYKYDSSGRVILAAEPSAISGYDDQYADLLHNVAGDYEYMRDDEGVVRTYAFHSPSGFLASGASPARLVARECATNASSSSAAIAAAWASAFTLNG
jgi:hypothetical protein